jgi:hypothetical protein
MPKVRKILYVIVVATENKREAINFTRVAVILFNEIA